MFDPCRGGSSDGVALGRAAIARTRVVQWTVASLSLAARAAHVVQERRDPRALERGCRL